MAGPWGDAALLARLVEQLGAGGELVRLAGYPRDALGGGPLADHVGVAKLAAALASNTSMKALELGLQHELHSLRICFRFCFFREVFGSAGPHTRL